LNGYGSRNQLLDGTKVLSIDFIYGEVTKGVVAALLAAGMYSYANHKIGACQASMTFALVPTASALIATFLFLDETLSFTILLGIIVVSTGTLLGALPRSTAIKLLSPVRRQS